MVWVVLAIGAVVVASVLVAVIGSLLPKAFAISRMASFNRPQADLWKLISDIDGQVSWRSDLRRVERLPNRNGREVWQETDNRGQSLTLETVQSLAPQRLDRRTADQNSQFSGRWTYEIAEFGEVTSLTITEESETYNPMVRFVSRVITGPSATIDEYLLSLGKELGVDVTITSV